MGRNKVASAGAPLPLPLAQTPTLGALKDAVRMLRTRIDEHSALGVRQQADIALGIANDYAEEQGIDLYEDDEPFGLNVESPIGQISDAARYTQDWNEIGTLIARLEANLGLQHVPTSSGAAEVKGDTPGEGGRRRRKTRKGRKQTRRRRMTRRRR